MKTKTWTQYQKSKEFTPSRTSTGKTSTRWYVDYGKGYTSRAGLLTRKDAEAFIKLRLKGKKQFKLIKSVTKRKAGDGPFGGKETRKIVKTFKP